MEGEKKQNNLLDLKICVQNEANEKLKAELSKLKETQEIETSKAIGLLEIRKNKDIEVLKDELLKVREDFTKLNEQYDEDKTRYAIQMKDTSSIYEIFYKEKEANEKLKAELNSN